MSSQAQIDANRQNAQKSTGPRTEVGKSRSRRNATRHTLCSYIALQHDEDRDQFDILLADLREEHQPDGPTEDILVYRMAEHFWFAWRAAILLAQAMDFNYDEDNSHQVALMMRYHGASDRGFLKNLDALRKLKKERRLLDQSLPEPEPIGFVPQHAEPQPEAPPKPPAEPSPMPEIVVNRPDQTPVVVSYKAADPADIRNSVENWLDRKQKIA